MHPSFTSLRRAARSMGLFSVGVLSTLGALSLTQTTPALAQSPGVSLASLVSQINTLTAKLNADEQTIAALKAKTAPLSLSGTDLTITGVNVHIISGSGSTNDGGTPTGLGNLIIGYNAMGNTLGAGDVRTGSHNLILGDQNNYSSYGGLVAGIGNTISARYASVSGGLQNTASGPYASASGGYGNTASSSNSTVSGGIQNTASGPYTSVSGGYGNTASGPFASVSGGYINTASVYASSVSGGQRITQSNETGWSGGSYHTP